MDLFFPTVNIEEKYKNKITVEIHEVYELMQIACSLTETFQKDQNLINQDSKYYAEFINHFEKYNNHDLILKLDEYLKSNCSLPIYRTVFQY